MKKVETIIIGGGISGLACAKKLRQKGKEFILITENLGGRVQTSKDGCVNYGAYFVLKDYYNFLEHCTVGRKIRLSKFIFNKRYKRYELFTIKSIRYLPQILRHRKLLRVFYKHFSDFRENCKKMSQKKAFTKDPFLMELYKKEVSHLLSKDTASFS